MYVFQNLRSSGSVPPQQPVVSVEGFVVELFSDKYERLNRNFIICFTFCYHDCFVFSSWFEMNCLLLEDPVRNISVQVRNIESCAEKMTCSRQ